jgi:hypothetical protein
MGARHQTCNCPASARIPQSPDLIVRARDAARVTSFRITAVTALALRRLASSGAIVDVRVDG